MAEREYTIKYVVDDTAALRALDNITRAMTILDTKVETVGRHLQDVAKALKSHDVKAASDQIVAALEAIDKQAAITRASLEKVGSGTGSMTSASAKAEVLAANLSAVANSAGAAAAGTSAVGGGMGGGGGAAGGGAGGAGAAGGAGKGMALTGLARQTAFAVGRAAVNAMGQGAEARKDYFETAVKRFNDYRQELREVANLQGKTDVTNDVVQGQLGFQRQTGMSADEAINFREQFLGAVGAGKLKGNIDDTTASALEMQAAQWAMRNKVDPATAGKMAGILPQYTKIASPEAGASKLAAIGYHLNYFGVGKVTEMTRAMTGVQAKLLDENGGRFQDPEVLAARLALTTPLAKSPANAATQMLQANRLMRRLDPNGVEGSAGYALNQLGITQDDDFEAALRKLAPKITGPNGDQWLRQNGFGQAEEREAVITQAKIMGGVDAALGRTDPKVRAGIEKIRAEAAGNNADFLNTETGRQRTAENAAFEQQMQAGQRQSRFERARMEAETRLRRQRKIDTPEANLEELIQTSMNFKQRSGRDDKLEAEIYNNLMQRTGVTEEQINARFPDFGKIYQPPFAVMGAQYGPEERAMVFEQVSKTFDPAYGGNPKAGQAGQAGKGLDKLGQAADLLKQGIAEMAKPAQPKAGGPPPGFVGGRP